jgi:hypothetical protein
LRKHGSEVEVPDDGTWPRQVQRALSTESVVSDFRPFRKLKECPELLATRSNCRLAIVHVTTWSSRAEIVVAIEALLKQSPTRLTGFVTAAPLLKEHALYTPGAQEAIFEFNDLLRETVARFPKAFVIDLHTAILAAGHRTYLSPWDSHLNQAGNDWLAATVLQQIAERVGVAPSSLKAAA